MIVGRGWGQGPTHAQSPHAMFAQVPGLQVVAPATPIDGYYLMKQSISSDNPIIFIEHRWLHQTTENFIENAKVPDLHEARIMKRGQDLTLISLSYGVIECIKLAEVLSEFNIHAEVINLRSLQPWDQITVLKSVEKTKKAIILDTSNIEFGFTGEISTTIYSELFDSLNNPILRFGLPMEPTPSSPALAINHYPSVETILSELKVHFEFEYDLNEAIHILHYKYPYKSMHKDQPDVGAIGPF
jgi:pyruvate dehydrogenase E1 component beta subunit